MQIMGYVINATEQNKPLIGYITDNWKITPVLIT